jgi:anaerobic magnesium-protoporphyrin IX monomethyl ester cyclase
VKLPWSKETSPSDKARILWLDLGDLGDLVDPVGPHEQWQDHGVGLLRTIMHQNGIESDILSTRGFTSWPEVRKAITGYEMMLMNVRSYTFPVALRAAKEFKAVNPNGLILTGGMHATVALDEMEAIPEFDYICQGPGEKVILDLVRDPKSFPRVVMGLPAKSMEEWPMIDRTLWPKPASKKLEKTFGWPLEPECGWGPGPVVTMPGGDDHHQPCMPVAVCLLQ